MANITWVTEKGSLGVFPSNAPLNLAVQAQSTITGMTLQYMLLNGQLPIGTDGNSLTIDSDGVISGTPSIVATETIYTFTVRAFDIAGNISDRVFSMSVYSLQNVSITTPEGILVVTEDSVYVDYQLIVSNPITSNVYRMSISSGTLPPGLQISELGRITGYPLPPITVTGIPSVSKTSSFTVQLISDLGYDTKSYSIVVSNHNSVNPPYTRKPVILNNKPLRLPIDPFDPYYGYYTDSTNTIPTIQSDNYFSFKIIGYNFDSDPIKYLYSVLPDGLVGNPTTGWITGTPSITDNSITSYTFIVTVVKANNPAIMSISQTYNLIIANNLVQDVQWVTTSNLGNIFNGSASELYVEASSSYDLTYRLLSGSLPPNLTLLDNGRITGVVPFQADRNGLLFEGDSVSFTFTVSAYNQQFPVISNTREFTVTVYQKYNNPVENVYFKASPNVEGRQIIQSLLTDDTLIPPEYLYRPDDTNFGKADSVKYVHIYGIESANIQTYLNATHYNHYYRKILLGELKTAVARNDNGDIIYEVVYSQIIDPLVRPDGITLPQSIIWPTKISLDEGPWFTSVNDINISSSHVYTSYDYGSTRTLYPASIVNMRNELIANMNHSDSQDLLPKWMTSQQADGTTLGFVNAWVICYTLPGYSATIKDNINNNWTYKLNMIDFSIDRFLVDKSATYNYNTNLLLPSWTEIPSNTPTPDPKDTYDIAVLFQQKTILPKNIDY
jgi:hypothetical protein